MRTFEFYRPENAASAIAAGAQANTAQQGADIRFLAGGTTLIDLMKLQVETPSQLLDINRLSLDKIEDLPNGGLKIGATMRNSDVAHHSKVQEEYAVLSQAILAGASAQLRNLATTAGNLLQRTRCMYFRDTAMPCNKRDPGTGCAAITDSNRMLAVLGTSEHCIATNPSDMCVAMAALEAVIRFQGPKGSREIAFGDFHLLPGNTPHRETVLEPGDLITHVTLPPPITGSSQVYLKLRDRASYEFALASAAVVINVAGGTVSYVRIALGGVGTKPWRSQEAENELTGKPPTAANFRRAAEAALRGAKARSENGFKIELAKRCWCTLCKSPRRVDLLMEESMLARQDGAAATAIGRDMVRVDGPLKVSGRAQYTSDFHFPGLLHAVPVRATIANGKVTRLDTALAEKMPGVKAIFHRSNIGPIFRSTVQPGFDGICEERRPPFEDDIIRYYGQHIALAVAETFETAKAAADAVRAEYSGEKPNVEPHLEADDDPDLVITTFGPQHRLQSLRGDPDDAFVNTPVKLENTYITPPETHTPLEPHATTAIWDGPFLTLYEASQGVVNLRTVLAQMFGLPRENVRVIAKFVGGGFGNKLFPWMHVPLAAAAARQLGRPVRLVLSRKMTFHTVGHRPRTQQRVRIGARPDGKLLSLQHDYIYERSMLDAHHEDCGEATPFHYSVPNLRVTFGRAKRNIGAASDMRGPGAVCGLYATESAMNELAHQLQIDPVKLRILNEPKKDEGTGLPFSSRHAVECFDLGAEKFGWSKRTPGVGTMKRDGLTLGWGMAGCAWVAGRFAAAANVQLRNDGTVRVASAAQDIGTGTYTILAQLVSYRTGVPIEKIEVTLGDTVLPSGPLSGGSLATASLVPAVFAAADSAIKSLLMVASATEGSPFVGCRPEDLAFENGRIFAKAHGPANYVPFADILRGANLRLVTGNGEAPMMFGDPKSTFSTHSYGCHFAGVTWQSEIARLRVSRVVSVIDAGKIINTLAGRNQIQGAVVMGIGMALLEHTSYDPQNGAPINSSLADYIVAVNADAPPIEVHFLDFPDKEINELGSRGIGEIGLAGVAAAITDAVHHATGVRVRELPVKIESLLA